MIVACDFETFYDADYSLRTMSTSGYIRHEFFKTHMMGMKIDNQPTKVYAPDEIPAALATIDWTKADLLCHNTAFDGFILSHHYGITPARYLCTLSMARGAVPNLTSYKLEALVNLYGLGAKMKGRLEAAKGVRELTPEAFAALAEYCALDVKLSRALYDVLCPRFPEKELKLIDLTLRMFCEPKFIVDIALAGEELRAEIGGKTAALLESGVCASELMSDAKFADLLHNHGAIPPTKISKTTGKRTWAFAKTDEGLRALLSHPAERVRRIVEARLKVKSTIGETRARRFIEEAQYGPLPVYLNYYGAHTGRWSGGNRMNLQNLPRGGRLRRALRAPEGYAVCVSDSAQIEARVTAWLADEDNLLDAFVDPTRDVYCEFGGLLYERAITADDVRERFISKTCVLGLGFGMGAQRLRETLLKDHIDMSHQECQKAVDMYRAVNNKIPQLWERFDKALEAMGSEEEKQGSWKCLKWGSKPPRLLLPNGLFFEYRDLSNETGKWSYKSGNTYSGLWGGIITENVVQAIARCVVAEHMLRITEHYPIVTMTHDEIVILAPLKEAEEATDFMLKVMSEPPSWAVGLPLAAKGGFDVCYSK